mmetsp:Transcript_80523/g.93947  ORF Transcript_80523/g.93947 Transcript_80523/m.93947 type:complete len:427 (+) Transcript_80523:52-1332(+)
MVEPNPQKESAKGEGFNVQSILQSIPKFQFPNMTGSIKNVTLRVVDPFIKEEMFIKHVVYKIQGNDSNGEVNIERRYSQFTALRNVLLERWPGIYIPPLPGKKLMGNTDPANIEERRAALEVFLNNCIEIPHLYLSEEFQLFLRTQSPDVSKALEAMPKLSYDEIIEKYIRVYSHLSGIELNNESVTKITEFQLLLTKLVKMFENFKKISKSMVSAKKAYYDNFVNFHQMLLVDYEKHCLSEYSANKDACILFNDQNNDKLFVRINKIREASIKDNYETLHQLIRQESREIKAFLQAIEQRDKYQLQKEKLTEKIKTDTKEMHKISEGKTTFKGLFTTKSKAQLVADTEKGISESKTGIEKLSMLHDMMTLIISNDEIARFKGRKTEKYLQVIKLLSDSEKYISEEVARFWISVSQSDLLKQMPSA